MPAMAAVRVPSPGLFVTLEEDGHVERQIDRVAGHIARGELLSGEPGCVGHYVHRAHMLKRVVDGKATRAL